MRDANYRNYGHYADENVRAVLPLIRYDLGSYQQQWGHASSRLPGAIRVEPQPLLRQLYPRPRFQRWVAQQDSVPSTDRHIATKRPTSFVHQPVVQVSGQR
jgi:hypothetical protein